MLQAVRRLALGLIATLPLTAGATKKNTATTTLHALMEREWQYQLEHSPTFASVMGDRRWNSRWDDLSLAAIEADHQHNLQVLAQLQKLDRKQLPAEDQLNYDLFRRDYALWVEENRFKWHLLPTNQVGGIPEGVKQPPGIQTAYQLADTLRFSTTKDYEEWIARLDSFGTYVDQVMALMREGMSERLIHPNVILQRIPSQLEKQLVDDATKSGFYSPFTRFPSSIAPAEQQRLSAAGRAAISRGVLPALKRFHQFMTDEYLPAAPEQVGIWQLPEGQEMYGFFTRRYTTTNLSPEQIHELGLVEVKRIRAEMEAVKAKTGFQGSLHEFFHYLRTDSRFYYKKGEDLLLHYRALSKQIDPRLVRLFKTLPRQPYGVEPTPEAMAPDVTTGFYYPAASDGSRPGTYLVNLYRPETRPIWEMVPLTLHEAVPGHHLQTSLAAEQSHLPDFRRYGYYVAYGEGWALYCETLGDELGLYDDPYDKFGQLAFDIWRAVRLVVDTGMHARRWSRQQAIDYFLENSPRQQLDIVNEVDRYIAWPGQALAYKVGQLKIRELRTRAERELGERFDVREFHDLVLLDGSLPLDILEQRVEAWLTRTRRGGGAR
ncbi:DUF885 domain-containing protein [Archangium lansingense]|uniref:DUF885 domain-containing protein n=1 Tax=Archangium lansingense TaxID=2995310 RepID=A0ABT4A568_9BACT|nr:DUF885 domain-containing protein [Archangium lansinium]MCY1076399.1 DUF885 domain-containing protein [Archangium lansinium]